MRKYSRLIWALYCFIPSSAWAVDVVRSPYVQEGEFQFDYKGKFQSDDNPRLNDIQEEDFGVGYSITNRWKTRLESEFIDQNNGALNYKYIGWANTLALTDKTSFLATAAFMNVVFANHDYIANYATAGLAVSKDVGPITNMANLFVKHEFGDTASGKPSLIYKLKAEYNVYPSLKPGFELFGDTQKQNNLSNESLKMGPGLFGTLPLGPDHIGYELAFLVGATPASPDATLQWRLSYIFP